MVQLTSRAQQCWGTAYRAVPNSRGTRSCVRSTQVRCFKGESEDKGNKPNATLRLNFKIPYRVNFGQSLGLVGSGESLGNWDPKRTVQMKWTDGDWWTVELGVSPGGTLDLEYKYVVVNSDGNVGYWKPGGNYRVTLPIQPSGTEVPKRVKVADAWDESFKKVDIEEAEAQGGTPSSNGTGVTSKANAASEQGATQQQSNQQPAATVAPTASTAALTATVVWPVVRPDSSLAVEAPPSNNGISQPSPASMAVPTPLQAVATAAQEAAIPNVVNQNPSATTTQVATAPQTSGTTTSSVAAVPPRATSPGNVPPNFAAVTTIPVIHPSLLVEQERLEDGVRNSLGDLQAQMDKHQLLRERIDDPAAVEILVADRIVAAANNRVVAYNKALKAVQEYNRLPPSASAPKDVASDTEK